MLKKVNGLLLCLSGVLLFGVVSCQSEDDEEGAPEETSLVNAHNIVNITHTAVERQTIGNCWIYAHAGWVESMHQNATGEVFDVSQSYWTYMHWFDQITAGDSVLKEISTGGHFHTMTQIIDQYGLMAEADFIPADVGDERSFAQSRALDYINAELKSGGELGTPEQRSDRIHVRKVMDTAWGLSSEVREYLDSEFGEDMTHVYNQFTTTDPEPVEGFETPIMRAQDFEVAYKKPGYDNAEQTLKGAIDQWRMVRYRRDFSRHTLNRVQRALHDGFPVLVSWFVDFNAMEDDRASKLYGSFNMETLMSSGEPGGQGGHLTILEDYEARVTVLGEPQMETLDQQRVEKDEFLAVVGPDGVEGAPFVVVPEGGKATIKMTGDGDADLYLRRGKEPAMFGGAYDCRPYKAGSKESCEVEGPAEVYVSVHGYEESNFVLELQLEQREQKILKAGVTLDPENPEDQALLRAALDSSSEIIFLRTKNSWGGAGRPGLPMAPGPFDEDGNLERGYHDLYMDYLNGPVAKQDLCKGGFDDPQCLKLTTPLSYFVLPPGY